MNFVVIFETQFKINGYETLYSFFFVMAKSLFFSGLAQSEVQKKNLPKEDFKVNREYDEHGNLIRFDSTYTYNWSGDTTLINDKMPENFDHFFNDHFKFFNDSSSMGNSFFGDFDQLFASPFSSKRDSLMMKKFGMNNFHFFNFDGDSLVNNFNGFDDFWGQLNLEKPDSSSSKSNKKPFHAQHRSVEDMMKMMQQQMKEMEEFHKKLFKE